MPRIASFYGITITMYFGDHNPPHFHAMYAGQRARFARDGRMLDGGFPRRVSWALSDGPTEPTLTRTCYTATTNPPKPPSSFPSRPTSQSQPHRRRGSGISPSMAVVEALG
ncbi:MAG: DUF4160 domain-containing protein [Acidimicrobiia bacterium]|nr:DUF4160 domain-containing protein [Acidimicrobiia bacterium]MBT8193722.1 DUF4160 domain-containing protein [Acidimicrobiia bacterium]MBT8246509.1 DUF4160 domain-containing protein [Acidimicrobiia bacterium]NNF89351.1 DUF4160 domain-containing protein [Acidimicrobiia bacterium]NNJ47160.1 DUF4160 domain-containing protein [Acidimicrobiia bacterium]